ncbi:carboxypeptidase regulatory-like domain-containing protein [Fictibacillus iocasae]|uniref:Carboxypeptidase regulatory-like domain-containing protein n=1 Tax=Fictibacillus iocasae TaxID=2715437 RepID=A0ABW2NKQ8_9BACL
MPFPPGLQFSPILFGTGFIYDSAGDESPGSTDLVGTAAQFPAAYVAYDETNVYFRIRVNEDPRNSAQTGFRNFAWGVLINTNGVAGTYQWLISVSGNSNRVNIIRNTTQLVNNWNDPAEGTGGGTPNKTYPIVNFDVARVSSVTDGSNFSGNPDFFIDFFVPAADLFTLLGINANSSLRFVIFSSANDNNFNKDSLRANEGFQFASAFTNPVTPNDVNVKANLTVVKQQTGGPTSAFTGQLNTYSGTITVTNTGKNQAINVFATDVFGFDQLSTYSTTSVSRGTAVFDPNTNVLSWNIGNIPANQNAILAFTASGIYTTAGTRPLDTVTVTGTDSFTGTVLPQKQATVNITVTASGGVAGQITNSANGQPIPGATVQLRTTGGALVAQTTANGTGFYGFSNISPGTYNLVVSSPTFQTATVSTTIVSNQTTTTNVALAPVPGNINGSVTAAGGGAISGATVRLVDTFGVTIATATTNAGGFYSFVNVTPGTYTLNVTANTFQSASRSIILDNAETETANFVLQPSPGTINGTVTSTTGAPISGALVEILNLNGQVVTSTTTNGSGQYSVANLAPGTYQVRISAANFNTVQIGAQVSAGQTTTVTAQLTPNPGSLSGTVTDQETGAPLVGASVRVVDNSGFTIATATTGAGGTYSISSLPPGSYAVTFGQEGYASQTIGAIITSNQTTQVNAQLRKEAGRLQGTVTNTGGTPLANASIQVFQNNNIVATTTTNASGFYQINNLAPGVYIVNASAPTFVTQQLGATINDQLTTVLNFQLQDNPGTLTGTVTDTGGVPISGASVLVTNNSGVLVGRGLTDNNGSYTITNLLAGSYIAIATADNYQAAQNGVVINEGALTTSNFQLAPNPISITGTVTNTQTGTPISGANVQVRINDANGNTIATTLTDSNGVYLVNNLAPGVYTIVISANDFQTNFATVNIPPGGQGIANIGLTPNPGRIQGLIFNATNNQPIPGAIVNITDINSTLIATTVTDSVGNFTVDGLPPGSYTLGAIAENFQNNFTGVIVFAGATTPRSLGLQPNPGSIQGTITPGVSGTVVELFTADNLFVDSVVTDETGNYIFNNLAPGSYNVVASAANFSTERAGAFVQSNQVTTVNLTLQPNPASVSGTVTDLNGVPIGNATIRVLDSNEVIIGTAGTDVNGNYIVEGLPPGSFTVIVTAPDFSSSFTGIAVSPGENLTNINFNLTPDSGSIAGQITNSTTGSPIVGATIVVRTTTGVFVASLPSGPFGNYVIEGLAPGSYNLTVSQDNFATQVIGATVQSNTQTAANVALVPSVGRISGTVTTNAGTPITGSNIQVKLYNDQDVLIQTLLAEPDGTFVFTDLAPGNYTVNANAPTFAANTVAAIVNANVTTAITVPLSGLPATLTGSVSNSQTGDPIAGATVTVQNFNGVVLATTVSGQDGTFEFTNLPAGTLEVTGIAPSFGTDSRQVTVTQGGTATTFLALTPNPGTLHGFITDLFSGLPIQGANVVVTDSTAAVVGTAVTDNRGEYTVPNLAPGRYIVNVSALNYGDELSSVDVPADTTVVLSFALRSNPGTVSGQVIDNDTNQPIEGATVRLRQFSPTGVIIATQITNALGNYLFTNVTAESYAVTATAQGFTSDAASFVITPGEQEVVNLFLESLPSTVRGTVIDAVTGSPLPDTLMRLVDSNGVLVRAIQTDANGQYLIDALNPGTYTLTAINSTYQRETLGFTVGRDDVATVNFALQPNAGFLTGVITDNTTGTPLSGATVNIYFAQSSTLVARPITDGFGQYQTNGLTPGSYTITATANNYGTSTVGATIFSDQTTTADLSLNPFPSSISGTVFTPEGTPLTNASIRVIDSNGVVVATGITGADGTYAISNLPQGSFTIVANATDFSNSSIGVTLTPGLVVSGINFTLERNSGTIVGRVTVAETGLPIAGANVSFFQNNTLIGSTATDSDGFYSSGTIAPGSYIVQASRDGFATNNTGAVVNSGQTTTANITLSTLTGTLSGSVIDTDGNPITGSGTIIQVINESGIVQQTVAADNNGNFIINNLLPGTYILNVTATNFATGNVTVTVVENQTTNVIVALASLPATLTGLVADPTTGNPISGASVTVTDQNGVFISSGTTDNNGGFVIQNLPAGTFNVTANASGFGTDSRSVTLTPGETEFTQLSLLPNPGSITGIIRDAAGTPVAGATVRVLDSTGAFVATVLSDSSGLYLVPGLSAGSYQVNVNAEGFQTVVEGAQVVSNTATTLNITLSTVPPGAVQGIVTSSVTGLPIAGASVQIRLLSPSGPIFATTLTDPEGEFFVHGLQPNTQYSAIVNGTNFGIQSQTFTAVSGETISLAFSLTPNPATVTGQVVGSDGTPLVNSVVRLVDSVTGAVLVETQTDRLGVYTIPDFDPGTYNLVASNPPVFQSQVSTFTASAGETVTVNFILQPNPGSLTGTVTTTAGVPIAGAVVELLQGTIPLLTTITNSLGGYSFEGVAPGSYTATATAANFTTATQQVTIEANEESVQNFALAPNPGSVSGTVTSSTGGPVSGASVRVLDQLGNVIANATTALNGTYSITNLPVGTFNVLASAEGFPNESRSLSISAGQNVTGFDFVLQGAVAPASVSGAVLDENGQTVANATVQILDSLNNVIGTTVADAFGNFSVSNLPSGSFTVRASAAGFAPGFTGITLAAGQDLSDVIVRLTSIASPGTITGLVQDPSGIPIPGAAIVIRDQSNVVIGTANTDANGAFTVSGLAAGSYTVVASADNFGTNTVSTSVSAGGTSNVVITLSVNPGTVTGQVTNAVTGTPIAGTSIRIADSAGTTVAETATDENGNYTVTNLSPGDYRAVAVNPAFQVAIEAFSLTPGETEIINFALLPAPGTVIGNVVDAETGEIIPGATIEVLSNLVVIASAAVNNLADYIIGGLPEGLVTIRANAPGYATETFTINVISGEIITQNFSLLSSPGSISGTVTDAAGVAVVGATVQAFDSIGNLIGTAATDQNGDYTIPNLPSGNITVIASAQGFANASTEVTLARGQNLLDVDLAFPSGLPASVSGTVTNEAGVPISGATIQILDEDGNLIGTATSDSNGDYTIPNLPAGSFTVFVSAVGFQNESLGITLAVGQDLTDVDFALAAIGAPGTLSGQVTNATGTPIVDTLVTVRDENGFVVATATTGPDGTYTITGLDPGTVTVTFTAVNFSTFVGTAFIEEGQVTILNALLTSNPGFITGTVTDAATGLPLGGTTVRILDEAGNILAELITDASGAFTSPGLAAGSYTVVVINPDYQGFVTDITLASGETVTLNIALQANPGSITGSVVNALTGLPIAGAFVEVFLGFTPLISGFTDLNGNFTFEGLPEGLLTVTASAPSFAIDSEDVTVFAGEQSIVNLALIENPASVSGQVVTSTGTPVANATVRAVDQAGQIIATVTTDSLGQFTFDNLPPGVITLLASADGFPSSSTDVTLEPGEVLTGVLLILQETVTSAISGNVIDTNGNPVAGAVVSVFDENGNLAGTAITDENGGYTVDNLPSGTLTVNVTALNFVDQSRDIFLDPGQILPDVDFILSPVTGFGSLSGTVTDNRGRPVAGALVEIRNANGALVDTEITNEAGSFFSDGLAAGGYTVTVTAAGFSPASVSIEIFVDQTTNVNIPLTSIVPPVPPVPPSPGPAQPSNKLFLINTGTGQPLYLGGLTFPTEFVLVRQDVSTGLTIFTYQDVNANGDIVSRTYVTDLSCFSVVYKV